jgi:hypothetical protein
MLHARQAATEMALEGRPAGAGEGLPSHMEQGRLVFGEKSDVDGELLIGCCPPLLGEILGVADDGGELGRPAAVRGTSMDIGMLPWGAQLVRRRP